MIDLTQCHIHDFDYQNRHENDDFIPVMRKVIQHQDIILATPIYWYGPSASMKRFIDRFSDLLSTKKEMGRALRGKTLHVLSTYLEPHRGKEGFEEYFEKIAWYLGMNYGHRLIYRMEADGKEKDEQEDAVEAFKEIWKSKFLND